MTAIITEMPPLADRAPERQVAEQIGLSQENLDALTHTVVHDLGEVTIQGTNDTGRVARYHTGPEDAIFRGGTKFASRPTAEIQDKDGTDHSVAMAYKIWGTIGATDERAADFPGSTSTPLNERLAAMREARRAALAVQPQDFAGGKTLADIMHHKYTPAQNADAMRQVAHLMFEAGLGDPTKVGTAGDEGTNTLGNSYIQGMREAGHPHPEATITSKDDMEARPAATGQGAAFVHRTRMELMGEHEVRAAVQGAGAAGLHYAAEAVDPMDPEDGERRRIIIPAISDVKLVDGKLVPFTLYTDDAGGLPITREMAHSLLTERGKNDPDMHALPESERHTLFALARKLERLGCNVGITDKDALFHDKVDYIAPAATSNVITRKNISKIIARKVIAIGNKVTHDDAQQAVTELGFDFEDGELVNAGGVVISIQEVMRDLRRIAAAKNGTPLRELSTDDYVNLLRKTQVDYTRKVYRVAEHMSIDRGAAIKVVSLGNMATNRGMRIDQSVRDLLVAA